MIEKDDDIKIADYIAKNCRKRQLFYAFSHPNNEVLLEITNRLLILKRVFLLKSILESMCLTEDCN